MTHLESYEIFANLTALTKEIEAEPLITTPLEYMDAVDSVPPRTDIYFTAALSGPEKTALDAIITAHNPQSGVVLRPKFVVQKFDNGYITEKLSYATDNGDGTYSDLVIRITYAYVPGSNNVLLSTTTEIYDVLGEIVTTSTRTFFSNDEGDQIEKKV